MAKEGAKHRIPDIDFRNLAEFIPGMIVMYDINTGEYIYVNQAIKKMLGYTPDALISGGAEFATKLVHPDDLPGIMKENQAALKAANMKPTPASHQPVVNFEYRMRHKDGRWVWLHTDGIVYDRTPSGKVRHVMNISIDITARKQTEEQLQQFTKELQVLNRTKDEFISIASHQLRTPATAVKQYLGLLLGGYSDPLTAKQETFLKRAYESNERQLRIVDDILKIAQLDAQKLRLKPRTHDIRQIVEEGIALMESSFAKKNQKVSFDKPSKPINAKVDKSQILMVIENLLENACCYSQEGKKIAVSLKKTGSYVKISIKDEGVGIAKKDIPKLFQKFSRIPNPLSLEADGNGLGLYWARRIMQLHGGDITLESTLGQGSIFTVVLPTGK